LSRTTSTALTALRQQTDTAILMLSGKDSMIAGALAADLGFRIHAAHLYLVPDLLCITVPLEHAAEQIGAASFTTYPTHYLGRIRHHGVLCDPDPMYPADLTLPQVEDALRAKLGAEWIVAGRRLAEVNDFSYSKTLREHQGRCEGVRRVEAIWDWHKADVAAAFAPDGVCARRGIPRPAPIGPSDKNGRGVGRGLNLFGRHLLWLWRACRGEVPGMPPCPHSPTCWQRLCVAFPFAPAAVMRCLDHGPQVESIKHYLGR
jgi:hypothetical protein